MESHFTRNAAKSEDYRKEEYKKRGTINMSENIFTSKYFNATGRFYEEMGRDRL